MKVQVEKVKKEKKITGGTYFSLAMLCFLALGFDALVGLIDYMIFGDLAKEGFSNYTWYMNITHWIIVLIIWGAAIWYVCNWFNKKNVLNGILTTVFNRKTIISILIAIIISAMFTLAEYLFDPGTMPQIVGEFNHFKESFGDKAFIVSASQNIYYIFEIAIVVLLLALMQKAGEEWFHNDKIPYGAVGLAFTWGLGHIVHGGFAALWVMGFSVAAGLLFVLCKKNIWATYIFIWFVFIL